MFYIGSLTGEVGLHVHIYVQKRNFEGIVVLSPGFRVKVSVA